MTVSLSNIISVAAPLLLFSLLSCSGGNEPSAPPIIQATGISLNKATLSIPVGSQETIVATVRPSNATDQTVSWASSSTGTATVTPTGLVTGISAGSATITATTVSGGWTATCQVTVYQPTVHVTGVSLNKTSLTLDTNAHETLAAAIQPTDATNKAVNWASSSTAIATVSSTGLVTGVSVGTATITVTTADGNKTATCEVTVIAAPIRVTGITLNKYTLSLTSGTQEALTATVRPDNATNKNVKWQSYSTSIAEVNNNGLVTAKNPGDAYIQATTEDGGYYALCYVTVTPIVIPSPDVYIAGCEYSPQGIARAAYWKNTAINLLTSGTYNAEARSIYVSGNDVYTAGYEFNASGRAVATVWRNSTVLYRLTNGTYDAYALSIQVSGNTTYVAGYEKDASGEEQATLWVNSHPTRLTYSGKGSMARKIVLSGSDTYIAGDEWDSTYQRAVYWRNGTRYPLNSGQANAAASSIAVSNGIVYVSGAEAEINGRQNAVLWTNGNHQRVSDGINAAQSYGLSVSNGNVYVSGAYRNPSLNVVQACYWLNGTLNNIGLFNTTGRANAILAKGNDLYVVGYEMGIWNQELGKVWKNKISTPLSDDIAKGSSRAWDVFVP